MNLTVRFFAQVACTVNLISIRQSMSRRIFGHDESFCQKWSDALEEGFYRDVEAAPEV